jgi:biopolymer transport protein TolR
MTFGVKNDGYMSDINVTPFVDVMLVLLIIFMVTAPMMMQGLDVALPEVTAKPLETETQPLIVTVNQENQIFINDFEVGFDFFKEKLQMVLDQRADRAVYFKADRSIPYGVVVQVMAEIKAAGAQKVGMVTEPKFSEEDGQTSKSLKQ